MGIVDIVGWCVDRGFVFGFDNNNIIIFVIDGVSDLGSSGGLLDGMNDGKYMKSLLEKPLE